MPKDARGFPDRSAARAARRRLALALVALLALAPPASADSHVTYGAGLSEIYGDNIVPGDGGPSDFITALHANIGWNARLPRSQFEVGYTPQYYAHAELDRYDHADHRLESSWIFTPGPRSAVGVRQGWTHYTRQVGFHYFDQAILEEAGSPVVPRTRRTAWDIGPFVSYDLTRVWRVTGGGTYRAQRYRRTDLIDSTQIGGELSLTAAVGQFNRVGFRVRTDRFSFDGLRVPLPPDAGAATAVPEPEPTPFQRLLDLFKHNDRDRDEEDDDKKDDPLPPIPDPDPQDPVLSPPISTYDHFTSGELLWNHQGGRTVSFSAAAGMFLAESGARLEGPSEQVKPTIHLGASWALPVGRVIAGYDRGYASYGGFGGVAASESADVSFVKRWSAVLETTARVGYISRAPLDETGTGELDGVALLFAADYTWPTGLGVTLQHQMVRQSHDSGDFNSREFAVGMTYAFDPRRRVVPAAPPVLGR